MPGSHDLHRSEFPRQPNRSLADQRCRHRVLDLLSRWPAGNAEDFKGNVTTYRYHTCCGRLQVVIDPLGNGQITNTDYYGNITHSATVEGLPPVGTYDWNDPVDATTLNEITTRFDARHRPTHRTVWLEPSARSSTMA